MRRALLVILALLTLSAAHVRGADTLSRKTAPRPSSASETFRWPQVLVPASLMTVGAFGVSNPWWEETVNLPIRSWAGSVRQDRYLPMDDYIQYLPAAAFLVLGSRIGREHGFGERVLVLASSWLFLGITVNAVKYTVRDLRPDASSRNAFPSGHTATAFMGAELVRHEYGPWWGLGAYAVASGTAFLRIYNNRHWFNDVLGGAAIGILSADIGYWLLPLERKWFCRKDAILSILPSFPGCGLSCVLAF